VQNISKNNLKYLRSLQQKKYRSREGKFLVEGLKMTLELIENQSDLIEAIFTTDELTFGNFKGEIFTLTQKELEWVSSHKSPNTCLALVRYPKIEAKSDFTLVLEDIQDPGNMGTIIRIADWYGIDDIVCSIGTVDCFNPKVVQACMGSLFRCKIIYTDLAEYLSKDSRQKYAALLDGQNIYQAKKTKKGVLMMGNEGNGLSDMAIGACDSKITIPRIGEAESLNVGVATAICLAAFFGE
jgi:TrmH family RNA methyltransferase